MWYGSLFFEHRSGMKESEKMMQNNQICSSKA